MSRDYNIEDSEFYRHFEREVGIDRWPVLFKALKQESKKVALENPFWDEGSILKKEYHLDYASLLPAKHLSVEKGQDVLDLCAAPGGKSLAMIFSVEGNGHWVLNELSKNRLSRLKRVIREYLPEEVGAKVKITNHDGSRWGMYEPNTYDKILLDAPCSGEQHLLLNLSELKKWSIARTKRLAQRQYALLCSGLMALKQGGELVYSTCSVSNYENDEVIRKLLKKKKDQFEVIKVTEDLGEATEFGRKIWPDLCEGWGPIYFCKIKKT